MNKSIHQLIFSLFLIGVNILNGFSQNPICTNPSLWVWGNNEYGQLGGTSSETRPTKINNSIDWKQVSAGSNFTVAIKTDGSLWAWGNNVVGQLGDGTTTDRPVTQIGNSKDWKQVACGGGHTVAIKTNGSLWAWGENNAGQLGDGTTINKLSPTKISSSLDWKEVACGAGHTVALKTNGSLWTWGLNIRGELGNGTQDIKSIPTQVGSSLDWQQISANSYSTMAIKTDGSLWAWGDNIYTHLGGGNFFMVLAPVQIGTSKDWKQVSLSEYHSLGVKTDGSLWAWGHNAQGEIGNGQRNNLEDITSPLRIGTGTDWQQVSAGFEYSLALKTNGTIWSWGDNGYGQLGDGNISTVVTSPQQIGIGTTWKQVIAGRNSSFALNCTVTSEFFTDPTACYKIVNKVSNKVLQVKDASLTDSAQIYQWASQPFNRNQLWQLIKTADGKFNIVSRNSGKLIDVIDNTPAGFCTEGTILQQFTADGTGSQKWRIEAQADGSYKIYNETCNKPLRLESGSLLDGANVGIKADFGAESFKWYIQEVPCAAPIIPDQCYLIVNKATGKALEIKDGLQNNGTQIYQWATNAGRPPQLWKAELLSDGKYTIRSFSTDKVMDVLDNTAAGFCVEGTIIQIFPFDGTNSQRWGLLPQTDGSYKIVNATCNKYLRVESASMSDGASVGIKNDFGSDAFKWYFQSAVCTTAGVLSATNASFGFEARASEGRAKLQWVTNTGYKTDYFEIERLNTNGGFEVLGKKNTEGGNDMKSYTFTDNDPLDGDNFYRINSISNGNIPPQYSEVKKVTFSKNDGISIFPNPADEFINVDLRKYEGKTVALSVYNSVGLLVKKQTIEKVSAAPQQVDVQGFGTGSYLLRVQSEGKREVTRLFHIVK